jgi:hypothetical protein
MILLYTLFVPSFAAVVSKSYATQSASQSAVNMGVGSRCSHYNNHDASLTHLYSSCLLFSLFTFPSTLYTMVHSFATMSCRTDLVFQLPQHNRQSYHIFHISLLFPHSRYWSIYLSIHLIPSNILLPLLHRLSLITAPPPRLKERNNAWTSPLARSFFCIAAQRKGSTKNKQASQQAWELDNLNQTHRKGSALILTLFRYIPPSSG